MEDTPQNQPDSYRPTRDALSQRPAAPPLTLEEAPKHGYVHQILIAGGCFLVGAQTVETNDRNLQLSNFNKDPIRPAVIEFHTVGRGQQIDSLRWISGLL